MRQWSKRLMLTVATPDANISSETCNRDFASGNTSPFLRSVQNMPKPLTKTLEASRVYILQSKDIVIKNDSLGVLKVWTSACTVRLAWIPSLLLLFLEA